MTTTATHTPADPRDWNARNRALAEALARSALGDRAAFRRVYELSSGHLFAVLLRIQRDRTLAEELLQEVFVSVWKAAGSFDGRQAQPLTWLTHIARHKAIDSLRRADAQPRLVSVTPDDEGDGDDPEPLDQRVADDGAGPAELLERAADARRLGHCMEGLSPPQRQSVALAFFDGLSHAEVAEQLRQPLGTVKSWVRRALQTLRGCLDRAVRDDQGPDNDLRDGLAAGGTR